jgi:DNA-binding ferritin-like protein
LLSDNKKLIEMLTKVSESADSQKLYATSNLVQEIMETHGKFVWMLRSFLKE